MNTKCICGSGGQDGADPGPSVLPLHGFGDPLRCLDYEDAEVLTGGLGKAASGIDRQTAAMIPSVVRTGALTDQAGRTYPDGFHQPISASPARASSSREATWSANSMPAVGAEQADRSSPRRTRRCAVSPVRPAGRGEKASADARFPCGGRRLSLGGQPIAVRCGVRTCVGLGC
jgi:hypothetical protein